MGDGVAGSVATCGGYHRDGAAVLVEAVPGTGGCAESQLKGAGQWMSRGGVDVQHPKGEPWHEQYATGRDN